MDNAADDKAIARKKQRVADSSRNRMVVLERLLSDAPGRQFVWGMIEDCKVFHQTVDIGPSGHAVMCFAEGKKSFGLALFNDIIARFPQQYLAMTKENAAVKLEDEEDDG